MGVGVKELISYLTVLELPLDQEIDLDNLKTQYRKLSHIYHPDIANDRYKDGKRFVLLKDAYDFISENIDIVNDLIKNDFDVDRVSRIYDERKQAQERANAEAMRKRANEERQRKEKEETERRNRAEKAKKEAEEKRKAAEAAKRRREAEDRRVEAIMKVKKLEARKNELIKEASSLISSYDSKAYAKKDVKAAGRLIKGFIDKVNTFTNIDALDNSYNYLLASLKKIPNRKKRRGKRLKVGFITSFLILLAGAIAFIGLAWANSYVNLTIKYENGEVIETHKFSSYKGFDLNEVEIKKDYYQFKGFKYHLSDNEYIDKLDLKDKKNITIYAAFDVIGEGSAESPVEIYTLDQLAYINDYSNTKLMNDLVIEGEVEPFICNSNFDGNFKTITIKNQALAKPLIERVDKDATIRNLNIVFENITILESRKENTSLFIGANDGTITDIKLSGSLSYEAKDDISDLKNIGLLSSVNKGFIENTSVDVTLNQVDNSYFGRSLFSPFTILNSSEGVIRNCSLRGSYNVNQLGGFAIYNDGEIAEARNEATATLSSKDKKEDLRYGGISLFNNYSGTISNSINLGTITTTEAGSEAGYKLSGIAYLNLGAINEAINEATITVRKTSISTTPSYLAGISAINKGSIKDSINKGSINALMTSDKSLSYIGGIVAKNYGEITTSSNLTYKLEPLNEVKGKIYLGFIASLNENEGKILKCYNNSTADKNSNTYEIEASQITIGGITAWNKGQVMEAKNEMMLNVRSNNGIIGGIVGLNDGLIANTLNDAKIYAYAWESSYFTELGGLCGTNRSEIKDSINLGVLENSGSVMRGTLIGYNNSDKGSNCLFLYAKGDTFATAIGNASDPAWTKVFYKLEELNTFVKEKFNEAIWRFNSARPNLKFLESLRGVR